MSQLDSRILRLLLTLLAAVSTLAPRTTLADEVPSLKIVFGTTTATLEGTVDSEATAETLASTLRMARPDLVIDRSRLAIDPTTTLPPLGDLRSLVSELALSTHEGRLELWSDRVVLGGLTDSLVTTTALKIRLDPILAGRTFINRVCIVGTEYLPKISVSLVAERAPDEGASPAASGRPPSVAFIPPGFLPEKLLPTLLLLANLDRLAGVAPPAPPSTTESETGETLPAPVAMPALPLAPTQPLIALPVREFVSLPSILFSRNSFLLQANQVATVDAVAKELLATPRRGAPVFIEPVKPSGGSPAFHDYLCERRADEVARLLVERGVDRATMTIRAVDSPSPIDGGEVRLRLEILPPPEPEDDPASKPESAPPATEAPVPGEDL